jgi:hypothetical protein
LKGTLFIHYCTLPIHLFSIPPTKTSTIEPPTDDYTEKGTYALHRLSVKSTQRRVHPGCLPLGGKPKEKKVLSANYNKDSVQKDAKKFTKM